MGAYCTCNCARGALENSLDEESSAPSKGPRAGTPLDEVKVPLGARGMVSSVAKLKVLEMNAKDYVGEPVFSHSQSTPRFEEAMEPSGMARSGTPSRSAAGVDVAHSPQPAVPSADTCILDDAAEVHYEGDLLDNKRHGFGTLRMKSCTYKGDFWHGSKHGQATLAWDDGRMYFGQFRNGKFHGHAEMSWPDGRRYTGEYADNQKHGEGIFVWADGRCYDGQWVTGKRHGIGTYTNAKGFSRRGTWSMDRPLCWENEALASRSSPAVREGSAPVLDSC